MTKVTLIKSYRKTETLRQLELQEVVSAIQSGQYQEDVEELRSMSFIMALSHQDDESIVSSTATPLKLPRLCFA